ncbi:peptidoglycan bridge formation glycyltransferase FemA/FemB family protein [Oceanithermus sp.]|uniref:lipid II:glycine glycyltransferase FemX n=1 Tax=Oceanithermus sp. TaxID=2268145 RepID=UPI00257C23A0|nr:peptidoglycan bridge formation glycyltransferase FemA/FemB family protein [Oceanithermus sp.]
MERREIDTPEAWNRIVSELPLSSSLQSWGWGEVKRTSGWKPVRLALFDGGEPVAAAQLMTRRLAGPLRLTYVPRGPALAEAGLLPRVAEQLARAARGALYLQLEPPLALEEPYDVPAFADLRPAATIQPEYSILVDLDAGEEAVLARMKSKTRYNIRLSARKGVTARIVRPGEGDAGEAFEAFWALFTETNRRAKLLQHARSYYETVFRAMEQPGGAAFISLAEYRGQPLAAGLFVAFAGRVDYLYGGSSREHKNVMAPYAMHWAAMRWGMERGYRVYDLWGVPRVLTPESHAYGIYRFKEGFGGRRVRFPAYVRPLSPLYGPVQTALRWRKNWVNWRTRGTPRDVL